MLLFGEESRNEAQAFEVIFLELLFRVREKVRGLTSHNSRNKKSRNTLAFLGRRNYVQTRARKPMNIQTSFYNGLFWVSRTAPQSVCKVVKWGELLTIDQPARLASKQAWPISSFNSSFSSAMASPTATKRLTAALTAWPTFWMARKVFSVFFSLSLWLISVVIWNGREIELQWAFINH